MQESFMIKQNWSVISRLWPAIFKCQHFEKPSIQDLLDNIFVKTKTDFDSFENRIQFSNTSVKHAFDINPELLKTYNTDPIKRLELFQKRSLEETNKIRGLMADLIKISRESQLLWKNQAISFGSVLFLANSCEVDKALLTEDCVQLFVDSLIHENISIRKIGIEGMCIILNLTKFKKKTKQCAINEIVHDVKAVNVAKPGYRSDNAWHLYDANFLNDCFERTGAKAEEDRMKWAATYFLDKSYWGYYCWPENITVNRNKRSTFGQVLDGDMDAYGKAVAPIVKRFRDDPEYVRTLIKYFTIEESKGNEQFDKKKVHFQSMI